MVFFPAITIIIRRRRIATIVVVLSILVYGGLVFDGHSYNWYCQCYSNGQPCYVNVIIRSEKIIIKN